ncbi:hydroxymethylglutaryl-CoA lyase [alpha proteobacterium U9-1i]|nr:hydroxymethylglutaryl-CoA lyase [alpha proteobacterium U9-1i]
MTLRSLLFVPGDSEKKLAKAEGIGADALILDLEDAVAMERKPVARALVRDFVSARSGKSALWVRLNPLDSGLIQGDLEAVLEAKPDGLMLPKPDGPDDVRALAQRLDELGAPDTIKIIPVASETPAAVFNLGAYVTGQKIERLSGITWGAEDLSAAIGASTNRDADGAWSFTYKMARSLTLLAAHGAGVQAIETLHADFRDVEGLRASSRAARAEGFSGRLAIHPDQVAIINEAFTPSVEEVAFARRIVAAFDADTSLGAVAIDGKMIDQPHLKQARNIIAQAEAAEARG